VDISLPFAHWGTIRHANVTHLEGFKLRPNSWHAFARPPLSTIGANGTPALSACTGPSLMSICRFLLPWTANCHLHSVFVLGWLVSRELEREFFCRVIFGLAETLVKSPQDSGSSVYHSSGLIGIVFSGIRGEQHHVRRVIL